MSYLGIIGLESTTMVARMSYAGLSRPLYGWQGLLINRNRLNRICNHYTCERARHKSHTLKPNTSLPTEPRAASMNSGSFCHEPSVLLHPTKDRQDSVRSQPKFARDHSIFKPETRHSVIRTTQSTTRNSPFWLLRLSSSLV
jgi:hypothetical protein